MLILSRKNLVADFDQAGRADRLNHGSAGITDHAVAIQVLMETRFGIFDCSYSFPTSPASSR